MVLEIDRGLDVGVKSSKRGRLERDEEEAVLDVVVDDDRFRKEAGLDCMAATRLDGLSGRCKGSPSSSLSAGELCDLIMRGR